MTQQSVGPVSRFAQQFFDYLPTLTAGLFVLALGVAIGWIVKRAVIRVLTWLRLDRLASRVGWRAALGKGDIRSALYNMLGSVAMTIVVLVFLDNALQLWGLTVLVRIIDAVVTFLPNLVIAGLIVGVGIAVANLLGQRVEDALEEEDFEHHRLVGRILKALLLTVVVALGLWQLEFARQLVLAAFLIAFGALGVGAALAIGLGSSPAVQKAWAALFERKKD